MRLDRGTGLVVSYPGAEEDAMTEENSRVTVIDGRQRPAREPIRRRRPSGLLIDLRWAYKHAYDGQEGTPQQEDWRKLYKEDREKFIAVWERQEDRWKRSLTLAASKMSPQGGGTEGGRGQDAPPGDPSEGRARELIHQLLEECREQAQAT